MADKKTPDYLFYNLKSGLIASYTTEILPYNMRAKGYTVMEYALYVSLFFNQYVNPIALHHIHWKYYIVFCCFLAFEFFVNWFIIIETRYGKRPLHICSSLQLPFSGDSLNSADDVTTDMSHWRRSPNSSTAMMWLPWPTLKSRAKARRA